MFVTSSAGCGTIQWTRIYTIEVVGATFVSILFTLVEPLRNSAERKPIVAFSGLWNLGLQLPSKMVDFQDKKPRRSTYKHYESLAIAKQFLQSDINLVLVYVD